jgi:hypothetical protein
MDFWQSASPTQITGQLAAGDCKCRDSRALRQKFLRPRLQDFADSLRVSGNDCEVSPSGLVGLGLALFPIPQCT